MYGVPSKTSLASVLLIEDDEVDIEAITRSFKKRRINCTLVVARNGIEGLEALDRGIESPYFILLDLNMPQMNGIEFLKALRNHPKHKTSVVFVLTTSQDERDLQAAYEQNVAGYLIKSRVKRDYSGVTEIVEAYDRNVIFPPETQGSVK